MNYSLDLQNTKVIDNLLSADEFATVNNWMNDAPYVFKNTTGTWNKVWSIDDGEVLHSQPILLNAKLELHNFFPELIPLMPFIEKIPELLKNVNLFDLEKVKSVIITPYVYPPSTSLSWHSDSNYAGAFTFYTHKYWNANWGGEFLTVEGDEYIDRAKKNNIKWRVFDNEDLENLIMEKGTGHFVYPKPNRIVFNKSGEYGILHKVNKSTSRAKERLTLQGFLRYNTINEGI